MQHSVLSYPYTFTCAYRKFLPVRNRQCVRLTEEDEDGVEYKGATFGGGVRSVVLAIVKMGVAIVPSAGVGVVGG